MSTIVLEPLPGGFDYDCGPDKLPGWLNEEGLPTACVENNPTPEPAPEVLPETVEIYPTPLPLDPPLTELPVTGPLEDLALYLILGILSVVAGLAIALIFDKRRNRNE